MHTIQNLLFFACMALISTPAPAATFVVDSLLDDTFAGDSNPGDGICDDSFPTSSECTLRAAIEEANALAGADRIEFSVAGEIAPDSGLLGALPGITGDLVIDASTAPGWAPLEPAVYLNGTAVAAEFPVFAPGIAASSGALEVYGLGIVGFPRPQIRFSNGNDGGRVDGGVLGLNADGDREPHPSSLSSPGIQLIGNNAVIGRHGPPGNVTGLGNVISGNSLAGIEIRGDRNEILGNVIGMSADGLVARPNGVNGGAGILLFETVSETPDNNRIGGGNAGDGSGNHLANNNNAEVEISGNNNAVDGNTFGFKPGTGVFFNNATPAIRVVGDGDTIGGAVGNRIIDRFGAGVAAIQLGFTIGSTDRTATNVTVEANEIGTDNSIGPESGIAVSIAGSSGNVIRRNRIADATFGIKIEANGNEVTENRLGIDAGLGLGVGPGNSTGIRVRSDNNQITFNEIGNSTSFGIVIDGAANEILGNDIGFSVGLGVVSNADAGVRLILDAADNVIQGNRILNNGGAGVELANSSTISGNTIFGNSIADNGGIGVDILEFELGVGSVGGPTANDPGDFDEGANRRMNYPEFGEAVPIAGTSPVETVVTFRVDSDPGNQTYPITVDFYRADGYGSREAFQFLDTATFDTFGADATVTLELPAGFGIDGHFTALATDADGNTSEFAPARSLGEVLFRDGYED